MAAMGNLQDLFVHELKDIYNAEKQLTRALPKMAKAASSEELRTAIENHLEVTKNQVTRLEECFEHLGKAARGTTCEAMKGLIEEGQSIMEEEAEPAVMDAALIAAAQKVEHYEIATYGTLVTWAKSLGLSECADLLAETLNEEEETDKELTDLALTINAEAAELVEAE